MLPLKATQLRKIKKEGQYEGAAPNNIIVGISNA